MSNEKDILDRVEELDDISVFLRKEDFYLESAIREVIEVGEKVTSMVRGLHGNSRGLVVCTDRRVIFVGRDFSNPLSLKTKSYMGNSVRSIKYRKGIVYGKLVVVTESGKTEEIKMIPNYQAKDLLKYV